MRSQYPKNPPECQADGYVVTASHSAAKMAAPHTASRPSQFGRIRKNNSTCPLKVTAFICYNARELHDGL